jgi:hypothetical protein
LLSVLFIFPVRESQQLPQHFQMLWQSLHRYYGALCLYYSKGNRQNLVGVQAQTFEELQKYTASLQDSGYELGSFSKQAEHLKSIQRLTALYEKMLRLDIHMPNVSNCPDLASIFTPLAEAMQAITQLFDRPEPTLVFAINTKLANIQAKIYSRRRSSAKDPSIKAAIFHDSIQLTLFIDILQALLVDLSG